MRNTTVAATLLIYRTLERSHGAPFARAFIQEFEYQIVRAASMLLTKNAAGIAAVKSDE